MHSVACCLSTAYSRSIRIQRSRPWGRYLAYPKKVLKRSSIIFLVFLYLKLVQTLSKNAKTMKTVDINTKLIDSYVGLLKNLSISNKLDLISKLTQSLKSDMAKGKSIFYKAYGAWDSNESADELISSIRSTRTFNRNIEEF
jgi:hypothetical protein